MILNLSVLIPVFFYALYAGNGISDEYHVIRHVMNLEAVNTYEGECNLCRFLSFLTCFQQISGMHCQADYILNKSRSLGRVCGPMW